MMLEQRRILGLLPRIAVEVLGWSELRIDEIDATMVRFVLAASISAM
jgi:hypothetical protein